MSSSSTSPSGIQLSLSDAELWKKFYPGTEMVLTSTKPRKMFPNLEYNIKGLDPDTLYSVLIYMERCDKLKYHFKKGKWEEAANGDPILQIDRKQHKDGGQTGDHWMKQSISFDHIRLTNNESLKGDQMILMQSMHLYQPVVVIKRLTDGMEEEFRLEMTRFYTVTAYQCEEQIKLKKELNKFASGFRAEGGHNRKKKDLKRGKKRPSDSPQWYPTPATPPTFGFPMNGIWTPPTMASQAPPFGFLTPPNTLTPPNLSGSSTITPPTIPSQTPPPFAFLTPPHPNNLTPPTLTPPPISNFSTPMGSTPSTSGSSNSSQSSLTPPPFTPLAPPTYDFNSPTGYPYGMWYWGGQWTPNTGASGETSGNYGNMENVPPNGYDYQKF